MSKSANLNIRVDPKVKDGAEAVYEKYGMTLADAVNVFLHRSISVGGLPFDLRPVKIERQAKPSFDPSALSGEVKDAAEEIQNFLDGEGRLARRPAKRKLQVCALIYLASKFESGREYAEKEVNELLDAWHTFGDRVLLRRELVDGGFLSRDRDGSRYRLQETHPMVEEYGA